MKKISPMQLFALMFCARCFSVMIFFPISNYTLYMAAVGISTGLQAVMLVPAFIFMQKYPDSNPCTKALSQNRFVGIALTVLYALFFMTVSFFVIGNFSYFLDSYFADYIPRVMAVICCTAGGIYAGRMSVQSIGRTASVVAVLFFVVTAVIVGGSYSDFNTVNFHTSVPDIKSELTFLIRVEFMRNSCLTVMLFLSPQVKGDVLKSAKTYLLTKLAALEIITAAIIVILGDFAENARLPFFSLAAYSSTEIIERYDAVFMSVWVLITLVKLGTYFHCSGECLRLVCPKIPRVISTAVTAVIPAIGALCLLVPHKWEQLAYYVGGTWAIVLFTAVIPLIILIFGRKENGRLDTDNGKGTEAPQA